jgi:hypothetical protein
MDGDTPTAERAPRERLWWRRVGWLIALWLGGVLAVGLIALLFRAVMAAVGLTR